jgi:colicin import membrane protein
MSCELVGAFEREIAMPRQLKTYVATTGFFDLAVAAPTMKAALEVWGAGRDLFQRGYAKETNDPAIVKATMAKPGTVLRRAVGAKGGFKEKADLPDVSSWAKPEKKAPPRRALAPEPEPPPKPEPVKPKPVKTEPAKPWAAERAAERKAARLFEAAQKKRDREAARAEATERKARERREQAIRKAESELHTAREAHEKLLAAIEQNRAEIEHTAREEDARWQEEEQRLQDELRNARG